MRFSYGHLAQFKFILPEAIILKKVVVYDERTSCMKPDLHISFNFGVLGNQEDQYMQLRKLFRERLSKFLSSYLEIDDVPKDLLPNPFNFRSKDLVAKSNLLSSIETSIKQLAPEQQMQSIEGTSVNHHLEEKSSKNQTTHEAFQALSRLAIQTLEFILTLLLLKLTAKPNYRFRNFFRDNELCSKRNWIFASAFGVGFLLSLVFLTSLLAERVIGPKAVSNLVLKEILDCSNISRTACFIAYCVVTPFLEETVYRGFLLASISSEMQWQQAVDAHIVGLAI
ncbi:CDT1-like protein b [Cucumis melo var. makuwa]|uniref:CDT1-like protein b n=1 Tax=Cucumis melo var. makuwa TaxID=1194695 RepID=A0A5D3CR97_CUCMM|nr:CDT1-like protein b [Cucumis melo var. makuwa]